MEKGITQVLLIDDNEGDVRLLRESLEVSDPGKYKIQSRNLLSEGLSLLAQEVFDVLLLDLHPPDCQGEAIFQNVFQKELDIPVIVLAGLDDQHLARRAVQAGAQDYLVKGEFNGNSLPKSIDYAIERHQLKEKIFELSITDNLTGLYNRDGFMTLAEQQLKLGQRFQEKLSLFIIDLEGLKDINDRFGHQAGDRALQATADVLRNTFREADILGRAGGDEFVVLAVGSQSQDQDLILQRLYQSKDAYQANSGEQFELNFSVGVSSWTFAKPKSLDDLMREADTARYRHKRARQMPDRQDELSSTGYGIEIGAFASEQPTTLDKITLLLIEDDPGDVRLIQEIIKELHFDCEVSHVDNLEEAFQVLNSDDVSLVLLDLCLRDSQGLDTLDRMFGAFPEVPVIVMTDLDDRQMAVKALQFGAQDFLTKDKIDGGLLERSIQSALERHRLLLQNLRYASELRRSEARLTSIFNNVAVGIYRTTPEGEIRFANRALIEMMGYDSFEQLAKRNLEERGYVDRSLRQEFKRRLEEVGFVNGMEAVWERADGSLIIVRESAKAIHATDGEILYYEGTAEDITPRIEAENQLRLQSAALDAAANAIVITDRDGLITWVNPAFEDLTGYALPEIEGQNPRFLKSGNHDEWFYKLLWDTILAGRVWQGEMINKRKDGSLYAEQQTIAPLLDQEGAVTHFIAIKQDISARKMADEITQRHLNELTILNTVASVGVIETDEDELIAKATDIIAENFYPDHFGVLLLDEAGKKLIIHDSYWGLPADFVPPDLTINDGVVGSVVRTGQPRCIPDVRVVPEFLSASPGTLSELCVPLLAGEKVIGVINAESARMDAFSEDDVRLMITVAGQLAIAIERIRQQHAEREQRIIAETLSDTALALNSSLAFDQILDQILINIERIVPYEAASLMLNENGRTRIIRQRGYELRNSEADVVGLVFPLEGNNKFQLMMETGQPIVIPNVHQSEFWTVMSHSSWIQSYLGVPIRKDDQTFGFLNLDHGLPGFFTNEHAAALRALADQLAIAMENARLFSEAQTRAIELARLYDASGALLASDPSDLPGLSQTIVDTIRTDFGKSNCSLFLVDPNSNQLKRFAASGEYSSEVSSGQELFVNGPGIVPNAVRRAEIVNVSDVTQWPDYVPNWQEARSEIAIPLIVGAEVIGIIDIQSSRVDAFSEDDERIVSVFAERAALSIENAHLYQRQQRQLAFLESLHQIDLAITGSMNLQVTMDVVAKQVIKQMGVDAVSVLILNPFTLSLDPIASSGFVSGDIKTKILHVGEGLGGLVVQGGSAIHRTCLTDNCSSECARSEIFSKEGLVSYYGIPLTAKGQIKGVLEMYHREDFEPDHEWENFAVTIATQAAIAIDNSSMFEDLEKSNLELSLAYDTTLEGWAKALELRDRETEGHARRVVDMTLKLARMLGIGGIDLVHLRRGALLHDVGKMGVPDAILQKPGPLSTEEWEIMRKHPVYAYEWLSSISYLRPVLDIPHYHHERWDGTGYPFGLKEEQIPLSARIFAIVDVWDALRSDRPYRKAWSYEKALAHIQKQSGSHFDPRVVRTFLALIKDPIYRETDNE